MSKEESQYIIRYFAGEIRDSDIKGLCESLKTNKDFTYLLLEHCDISLVEMRYVCELLEVNNIITLLDFSLSDIDDEAIEYLCKSLERNKTITELYLQSNGIGNLGAQYLSNSLKKNQTLKELNLDGNKIDDEGAIYFYENLRSNETLEKICLTDNNIPRIWIERIQYGINERQKYKTERQKLLLLCRTFVTESVLYEGYLPLDIFKIIWNLSVVKLRTIK